MTLKQLLLQVGRVQLLTALLLLSGFSCDRLAQSGIPLLSAGGTLTPIHDLQQQPQTDSPVYLRGQVERQVPLLSGHVYELRDQTGSIWVFAPKTILTLGTEVTVQGTVRYQGAVVEGQEWGEVYVELQEASPSPLSPSPSTTPAPVPKESRR
ncbi:hypothetical protein [Neosynechococcus sphagnicola]|uniref:hypothetical protein n=1 Tax=Neosynechococcus sphagnicola TaxID=1501145 RepID=UPI0006910D6E|nr:hypothetical protein [Neosynechococcus sphagnicola]